MVHLTSSLLHRLMSLFSSSYSCSSSEPIYLLGSSYLLYENNPSPHPDPSMRPPPSLINKAILIELIESLVWFSYRRDFPPLGPPPALTSDRGWGCMLRSVQMIFCAGLIRYNLGTRWIVQKELLAQQSTTTTRLSALSLADRDLHQLYSLILSWFADLPDTANRPCPYSLHSLLDPAIGSLGLSTQVRAGEWFGPNAALQMLLRCCAAHQASEKANKEKIPNVLIFDHAAIYVDQLKFPAIIFLPLRLGLDRINPIYYPALHYLFRYPHTLGFVGGRPRSSLYFIASHDQHFLHLDPHTVQPAERADHNFALNSASYHTTQVGASLAEAIDPSLAIGFLIRSQADWLTFIEAHERERVYLSDLNFTRRRHGETPAVPLFAIEEKRPEYENRNINMNTNTSNPREGHSTDAGADIGTLSDADVDGCDADDADEKQSADLPAGAAAAPLWSSDEDEEDSDFVLIT